MNLPIVYPAKHITTKLHNFSSLPNLIETKLSSLAIQQVDFYLTVYCLNVNKTGAIYPITRKMCSKYQFHKFPKYNKADALTENRPTSHKIFYISLQSPRVGCVILPVAIVCAGQVKNHIKSIIMKDLCYRIIKKNTIINRHENPRARTTTGLDPAVG